MSTEKELQKRASHLMQAAREAKDPQLRSRLIASATFMAHQAEVMRRRGSHTAPDNAPEATALKTYTLYFMADGHFSDARHFTAGSDEAALAVADAIQDACSDAFQTFELWQRSRRIVGKAWPRPAPLPAEAAAESQARVLELEELLLSSRRALAESSKLIPAADELRNKLRRKDTIVATDVDPEVTS